MPDPKTPAYGAHTPVISARVTADTAAHFRRLAKTIGQSPGVLLRKLVVATTRVELAALEGRATEEDVLDRLAEVAALLGLDTADYTPDQVLAAVQALVNEIPTPPGDALLARQPAKSKPAKPSPRPAPNRVG